MTATPRQTPATQEQIDEQNRDADALADATIERVAASTTITFVAHNAIRPEPITLAIVSETADEITGVRQPAERYGHGHKTWRRDEITITAALLPATQAQVVEQCTDALSDVIIERLAELGFDESTAGAAESACYAAVAEKIAPPAHEAARELLAGDWDDAGSDTVYLPRNVADRLLERQGWILEPVGPDYFAYTIPGHKPRSQGGKAFADYVWERADAIRRALIAEALR